MGVGYGCFKSWKKQGCLATFVERQTRFYMAVKIKNRSATEMYRAIQALYEHFPENTFKTYQSYIQNTLNTPYTNGPIEGINNIFKVIKRIAFDYRSFYHFKSRILMIQNLTKPKVKILAA